MLKRIQVNAGHQKQNAEQAKPQYGVIKAEFALKALINFKIVTFRFQLNLR